MLAAPAEPMARQLAKLLTASDLDELREVVARWLRDASSDQQRAQYRVFGDKLLALKVALASAPRPPSAEELELALTMMLKLAGQRDGPMAGPSTEPR